MRESGWDSFRGFVRGQVTAVIFFWWRCLLDS